MTESVTNLPIKHEKTEEKMPAQSWAPFTSLRREIDRLFEDFRPFEWRTPHLGGRFELPSLRTNGWDFSPDMDLVDSNGAYVITAELPGLDEKNIDIKLSNNLLTIRGEKKDEMEERQKEYYICERSFGSFQRSFEIPRGVDVSKIEAVFSKGVLKINLPKTPEALQNEKTIQVKSA